MRVQRAPNTAVRRGIIRKVDSRGWSIPPVQSDSWFGRFSNTYFANFPYDCRIVPTVLGVGCDQVSSGWSTSPSRSVVWLSETFLVVASKPSCSELAWTSSSGSFLDYDGVMTGFDALGSLCARVSVHIVARLVKCGWESVLCMAVLPTLANALGFRKTILRAGD